MVHRHGAATGANGAIHVGIRDVHVAAAGRERGDAVGAGDSDRSAAGVAAEPAAQPVDLDCSSD